MQRPTRLHAAGTASRVSPRQRRQPVSPRRGLICSHVVALTGSWAAGQGASSPLPGSCRSAPPRPPRTAYLQPRGALPRPPGELPRLMAPPACCQPRPASAVWLPSAAEPAAQSRGSRGPAPSPSTRLRGTQPDRAFEVPVTCDYVAHDLRGFEKTGRFVPQGHSGRKPARAPPGLATLSHGVRCALLRRSAAGRAGPVAGPIICFRSHFVPPWHAAGRGATEPTLIFLP